MSRVPPCLLYLAIYNPTLSPVSIPEGDEVDEDLEEQAHILFYTSKERAVSRDRMLRQIGLAKALVNFSELFDPRNVCESVHSQSRRMVMVSPEPNFWINANIELSKVPSKPKPASKGKTSKEKPKEGASTFDYEDGTIHDLAIQEQLMQGYEKFKMLHGSFANILAELGQEALELQLERFFTVWAWSWNLEKAPDIMSNLGAPIHPFFSILVPLLDGFSTLLPEHVIPTILTSTSIIPSSRYTAENFPSVLVPHLASLIPPPSESDPGEGGIDLSASVDTIKEIRPEPKSVSATSSVFNLSVDIDVRKWKWPGYLTFGKNSPVSSSSSKASSTAPTSEGPAAPAGSEESKPDTQDDTGEASVAEGSQAEPNDSESASSPVDVKVDPTALEEALLSHAVSSSPNQSPPDTSSNSNAVTMEDTRSVHSSDAIDVRPPVNVNLGVHIHDPISSSPESSLTIHPPRSPTPPSPLENPEFSMLRVHLASGSSDVSTPRRRNVHYFTRNGFMLVLLGLDDTEQSNERNGQSEDDLLSLAAEHTHELLDTVEMNIQRISESKLVESLPSVAKILQPSDGFGIFTGQYTISSPEFSSNSCHLHNAKDLLRRDPNILEVFDRGQNPQHWHVSKRGLASHDMTDTDTEGHGMCRRGEMYLEVFRKEATLPDVDNVLAGILRKSGVVESGLV